MASHPYYPIDASIPYAANATPLHILLPKAGLMLGVVLAGAYYPTTKSQFRPIDRFAVVWFALCGFLHVGFEGRYTPVPIVLTIAYFVWNHDRLGASQTLFAQLWKEYALSDSRYLIGDVFTLCVETLTVLAIGPLCWMTYFAILFDSPARHVMQTMASFAHLYGVALYYSTNWLDFRTSGVSYSRPEFLYFWVYYVGLNAPWVVVPIYLLRDSLRETMAAFRALAVLKALQKQQ